MVMANETASNYGPKEECLKTLKVFGDYWTFAILFCLRDRGMRFGEMQKEMSITSDAHFSLKAFTKNKF